MNKFRKQAEASEPKDRESPHKILARRMLEQWAKEVNQGEGAPNILAGFERIHGDPFFHVSPGPIFTPMSQRTERILRDLRTYDPRLATLLMATALDYSHQRIANADGSSKQRIQDDLREGYGAFSTSFYYLTRVIGFVPARLPYMLPQDIGLDHMPELHPDFSPPRQMVGDDIGI